MASTPSGVTPEMQALVPLRESIVRKALLIRIEDVPLGRYFEIGP